MALENVVSAPSNPVKAPTSDVPESIPRDQWKRPRIRPYEGAPVPRSGWTRASTFGSYLEDQFGISRWRQAVVLWGAVRDRAISLAAKAVPTHTEAADKTTLYELADRAFEKADGSAAANVGTALHAVTERIDKGEVIEDLGEDRWAVEAYRERMAAFEIHLTETFVVCDEYEVAGTFDRLVSPRGRMTAPDGTVYGPGDRLVFDLKTSSTADYFGIKFAVQLLIYALGKIYDPATGKRTEHGADLRWALILHLPSGGSVAELYWVDLTRGRELAELAAKVRDARKIKALVVPAQPPVIELACATHGVHPGTVDCPSCAYSPREGEAHATPIFRKLTGAHEAHVARSASAGVLAEILAARSRDELKDVWTRNRDAWTDEHTEASKARLLVLEGASA